MKITIDSNCSAIVLDLKNYAAEIPKAMVRAMNRAIESGRTAMVREIARDTRLKSKVVRDAITLKKATITQPAASISAPLKRLPLAAFGARQSGAVCQSIPGLVVEGATLFAARSLRRWGAGIAECLCVRVRSGCRSANCQVYPSGTCSTNTRELGIRRVEETFVTNFEHELEFATKGAPPSTHCSDV